MSYFIWCDNVEVYLDNHEVYTSKEEILNQISVNNQLIEEIKTSLFGLCCGNPAHLLSNKDWEGNEISTIEALQEYFKTSFSKEYHGLEYLIAHNVKLQYIADNWDKHKEG